MCKKYFFRSKKGKICPNIKNVMGTEKIGV